MAGNQKPGEDYVSSLMAYADRKKSIVCLGADPVLEKIPDNGKGTEERIAGFFSDIFTGIRESQDPAHSIASVKPNYAYFAQYGFEGLRALKRVIDDAKKDWQVILDVKRGDIGASSAAYAKEAFEFWGADAITVAPYMGHDSLSPFFEYCKRGKGVYVLVRTSNPGSADFQSLNAGDAGNPLFLEVAAKLASWHENGVGAVVGATDIAELEKVSDYFAGTGKHVPLLIPGVGAQGGSAGEAIAMLKKSGGRLAAMHRINSSSGITYCYLKKGSSDPAGAALDEIGRLNSEIGKF
ncbi:MAG: orotidine-5'-phosphate decarboxylase [Candidatus Micrarchaeia archaeon]